MNIIEQIVKKRNIDYMKRLVDELNTASSAYYSGKPEIMSDYEWDQKLAQLKVLERQEGVVLPDSPTNNVSYENSDSHISASDKREVTHEYPALSLAKSKSITDLKKWAKGEGVWLSWKEDGASMIGTWDNGKLTRLESRGNGYSGLDITNFSPYISGVPKTIQDKRHIVVRGEVLISYDSFESMNAESMGYSNPRNLVSGSLNLKDPSEAANRHLHWVVYNLIHQDDDGTENELSLHEERMNFLGENGFDVVPHEYVEYRDIDKKVKEWENRVGLYEFPCDGLVAVHKKWKSLKDSKHTGHHFGDEGWALKFADESKCSVLQNIEWQVSANSINPVAVFSKIDLGATITRASLCNVDEIKRLNLGGAGSQIEVIRANMVIPKVVRCIKKVGEPNIPTKCPVCGSDVEVKESANGSHLLVCKNTECPGRKKSIFERFVSKPGMNMDGLSSETVDKFINKGWVKQYADFYTVLPTKGMELSSMNGFGAKSAHNIISSINKSRDVSADHFLYALSIPMVGTDVIKKVLAKYSFEDLMDGLLGGTLERSDFSKIDGIGPEKANALVSWFSKAENNMAVRNLLKEVHVKDANNSVSGNKCAGSTFVITGDVHTFKNRNEFKSYVESQGGKVVGSISKKTSYLVNNDINSTSGKNRKAQELGIPIISEDEFIKRFGK